MSDRKIEKIWYWFDEKHSRGVAYLWGFAE